MSVKTFDWEDDSGDVVTITYDGTAGTSTTTVRSDANDSYEDRSITVDFETTAGNPKAVARQTITQYGNDIDVISYDNKTITYNNKVLGYAS